MKEYEEQVHKHQETKENFSQGIPAMKEKLTELVKLITEKHVKKINEVLSKKSPIALVSGIESFVAILRNHKTATNDDVELYFHDYSRLIFKLENIQANTLFLEVVEHHK